MIDKTLHNDHLDGSSFFWPGGDIGLLLIHGFTATTTEVRLLAEKFKPMGYTISAPLLPGHGTTLDDLNSVNWQRWVKQTEISFQELKSRCNRIIVGGESMGSLLALNLASYHKEISLVLAYSPAIKVKNLWASQFIFPFIKYLPKKNLNDGLLWKGYKYNPVKASVQLLRLQRIVKKRIKYIKQPVAVFLGARDHTIDLEGGLRLFDKLPAEQKSIYTYPLSSHCMILDKELEKIFEQTAVFINQSLS